jgi:hypothetical protein
VPVAACGREPLAISHWQLAKPNIESHPDGWLFSFQPLERTVTKDELIAAMKKCAAEVGHAPTIEEFRRTTGINKYQIRIRFGTYIKLLREAGLDVTGFGRQAEMSSLFLDWARIVRRLKKIPTIAEYDMESKYSTRPVTDRFHGWRKVAAGMRQYAIQNKLEKEWADVMAITVEYLQPAGKGKTSRRTSGSTSRPKIKSDQRVYGAPLLDTPFTYAPTNENGVLVAFGSVARDLGFSVLHIQNAFPDCEAMREIEPGRWQRVRLEFEYESRNFITHMHPVSGCELIICWIDNWPECPLEVIALSDQLTAISENRSPQTAADERR